MKIKRFNRTYGYKFSDFVYSDPPMGNPSQIEIQPLMEFFFEGDNVTLTCHSPSASNPIAVITWSCKGHDMTSYAQESPVGYVATSNISITLDKGFDGMSCICSMSYDEDKYLKRVATTFTVHCMHFSYFIFMIKTISCSVNIVLPFSRFHL